MAIVVPTPNLCDDFSRVNRQIPVWTLDTQDSC